MHAACWSTLLTHPQLLPAADSVPPPLLPMEAGVAFPLLPPSATSPKPASSGGIKVCENCGTTTTPLWRKDKQTA